jgi:hypothetical protein
MVLRWVFRGPLGLEGVVELWEMVEERDTNGEANVMARVVGEIPVERQEAR